MPRRTRPLVGLVAGPLLPTEHMGYEFVAEHTLGKLLAPYTPVLTIHLFVNPSVYKIIINRLLVTWEHEHFITTQKQNIYSEIQKFFICSYRGLLHCSRWYTNG